MKNFVYSLLGIICMAFMVSSCSENIITDDDQIIFETQAIDKKDSTTPNSDGGEEVDNDED